MKYHVKEGVIVPFARTHWKQLIVAIAAIFMATVALTSLRTNAVATPVYDSTVNPLPGNMVSLGFQATQTAEVGARIVLAPGERKLDNAVVTMSSWACQTGGWNTGDCVSAPDSTFQHPITLTLYNVDGSGVIGTKIGSFTQDFAIKYRPSADPSCTGPDAGKWSNGTTCFNGYAQNIVFDLNDVEVPNEFVYGVSYNTNTWGYSPLNASGPYESLNVALVDSSTGVTVGNLVDSYDATGATPQFEAMGGWIYTPAVQLNATEADTTAPAAPVVLRMEDSGGNTIPDGGVTESYSVTTFWSAVDDAAFYEYSYWNAIVGNPYKEDARYIASPVNGTSLSGVFNQGEGTHFVAVRAVDAAGNRSEWSNTYTVIYDDPATQEVLASKDECKNGGWMTDDRGFKNQGDCVSFFATKGKNQPAETTTTTTTRRR